MNKTIKSLWTSAIALTLCVSMLLGTTFAWFTDSVSSGRNTITAGNLDVELEYMKENGSWAAVRENTNVFKDAKWEPGYTEVVYLRVTNAGELALKYMLNVAIKSEDSSVNVNGEIFKLSQFIKIGTVEGVETAYADRNTARDAVKDSAKGLREGYTKTSRLAKGEAAYVALVLYIPEEVGNEANHAKGERTPKIDLGINLVATQADSETDGFGNSDYDKDVSFPALTLPGSIVQRVEKDASGAVAAPTTIESTDGTIKAEIPAGVQMKEGADALAFLVAEMENSEANITLADNEILRALNVHIEGVAEDNTVPMTITVKEALMPGLNLGNFKLYHMENGVRAAMTRVETLAELDLHNEFVYDPATGDVTLAMASFSEVALVADTENAWNGTIAEGFATGTGTEDDPYIIANADQLAYFGAVVGGMRGAAEGKNFKNEYVKLVADINLGDDEAKNEEAKIFYPIGYYNSEGTYEKTGTAITSGLRNFSGTFDGDGHTVANFYQNTWEMKGDNEYYAASEQYYRDGMGLFGKIYGGTVKNLTVTNFSSDGEYTTTGTIAAYADGATFENIAIFDCNPRVYNIGNVGIVGCVGWYAKEADLQTKFTNITVDNSNKISALWGSYDVACGGIVGQYYPTSGQTSAGPPVNGGVHFENCHISAQMDVYNDVCGSYQYYAYRYAGILMGSVRENKTIDGHVYPKMDGITAKDCTVHFGTWNDYYYCELADNPKASYTHDRRMTRLVEIKAIDGTTITYLDGTTGTVPTSGRANYVIVDYTKGHGTENATCYHFKDGAVWTHDMGGIQTGIDENGDGQDDLVEDKQHIYLEFNNLVTGYGWGVTSKGVNDMDGVTILDRKEGNSVEKFEGKVTELTNNITLKLSDIFNFVNNGVELVPGALAIGVTNVDDNNPVSATIVYDRTTWENSTITFTGVGVVNITIQDYYFCTPTTITVNVTERQPEEKFDVVMNNGDFLHRVGNSGTVALDKLFKAKDGVTVGTVSVTVEAVDGSAASGTYSNNAIQFNGTGAVKVTITDNDYCIPTELYLEVVDAVNATGATSATKNNVVLLNDCGFSSLEVSSGYTLYGNGFTMTCASDSAALDMGYSFVTLTNGTIDNVQIVCPNFDYAVLYKSNMTESGNRSETTDRTRYFNVKSGVMVSGNSQILNSRISGGRAAVNVSGGNCLIDNSRLELGAVASLLVGAANSLTLRDVTLVQKPTASTHDTSKNLMGFSVLMICNSNGDAAPLTLEGTLVQNAWVDESDKQYVPSDGKTIVENAMKQTDYLHDLDGDGTKESLNLGFAYMPESLTSKVNTTTITDNRTDKSNVPYDYAEVAILNGKTYVYSYKNTNGTKDSFKTESEYVPNKQGDIITVSYSDTADGLTTGKSFGADGWVYELNVDLDKLSGYALDFSKISMSVNGVPVTDFKVDGNAKPTTPVAVTAGGVNYTLTATIDGKEYTTYYKVTGTETSKESPSLVTNNYEAAILVGEAGSTLSKDTWHGAAPVLNGIQIKYWSVAEKQYKTINLSDYTPTTAGKQNGTNTTWTYSPDNGDFTLTLTGGQVHSSNNVSAMPVVCNGKLYFVPAASNGLVNYGNGARTIPVTYSFKDNNGGTELTFSHTWSIECPDKATCYDYSDFCNGTSKTFTIKSSNGNSCVTGDTLVTLADGTQKRIDEMTTTDLLLVWNFYTGEYTVAPIVLLDNHGYSTEIVTTLYFADGTSINTINGHGFFDVATNEFILLDANNAADYIGHSFVKQVGDGYATTELVSYSTEERYTEVWSLLTSEYYNCVLEGMWTLTAAQVDNSPAWLMPYEIGEDMKFEAEKMQADIERYGLYTYDDFAGLCSYEEFIALGLENFKVSVGKGFITWDEILYLLSIHVG